MDAQSRNTLAERMKQEAQQDKTAAIVRTLDKSSESPAEMLSRIDDDAKWWGVWRVARVHCPSDDVRQMVREQIRSRLPTPYALTNEDRELLREMETQS